MDSAGVETEDSIGFGQGGVKAVRVRLVVVFEPVEHGVGHGGLAEIILLRIGFLAPFELDFGRRALPAFHFPVDETARPVSGNPFVIADLVTVAGHDGVLSVGDEASHAVGEVHLRHGHLRRGVVCVKLFLAAHVPENEIRLDPGVEREHQVQHVCALARQIQTRACVNELHVADPALQNIIQKLEQLRVISKLMIDAYLGRGHLAQFDDGGIVLVVERERLLHDHARNLVLVCDREQLHAEIRLRDDVEQIRLLLVEHLVDIRVLRRQLEVCRERIEHGLVHVTRRDKLPPFHVSVSIRVPSTATTTAKHCALVHHSISSRIHRSQMVTTTASEAKPSTRMAAAAMWFR